MPSPEPIQREQVAREMRAVFPEDIEGSAYRALIWLARIRTSGESRCRVLSYMRLAKLNAC
jgi:hypothetical protein